MRSITTSKKMSKKPLIVWLREDTHLHYIEMCKTLGVAKTVPARKAIEKLIEKNWRQAKRWESEIGK